MMAASSAGAYAARSPFRGSARGFTLVELMIAVAVVAILSAIAYPSYIEYVARGHRTQLKAQMSAAQQWLERRYSERYFYGDAATGDGADTNSDFAKQAFATSPPADGGQAQYDLDVEVGGNGQTYTIIATRRAGSPMANDPCGEPTVTNAGVKGMLDKSRGDRYDDDAAAIAACWR